MPSLVARAPVVEPVFPLLDASVADWSLSPGQMADGPRPQISGVELPSPCRCFTAQDSQIVWMGHNQWMVVGPLADTSPPAAVHTIPKSDARTIFTMPSDVGLHLMSYGSAVDFDPLVFKPGYAAPTKIAHFAGLVWYPPASSRNINVAVFRSYAESFNQWLADRLHHLQSGEVA